MKTNSKFLIAVLASVLLSTAAFSADRVVKRIDHPNGPDTFAYVPAERAESFGSDVTVAYPAPRERTILVPGRRVFVPVDNGLRRPTYIERRETTYIPVERW